MTAAGRLSAGLPCSASLSVALSEGQVAGMRTRAGALHGCPPPTRRLLEAEFPNWAELAIEKFG